MQRTRYCRRDRFGTVGPGLRSSGADAKIVFLLILLFLLNACGRHVFTGTVFADPRPAALIYGENYDGVPFDLANLKGTAVLLFFGYTFCPDICPLTLTELATAKRTLERDMPDLAADIQVVFVSVDPQRDHLARLQPYVQAFHPNFYGVRVSAKDLEILKPAYGLYTGVQEGQSTSDEFYFVDHTSRVYFINRDGNWQALFQADVTAEDLIADLKVLLR